MIFSPLLRGSALARAIGHATSFVSWESRRADSFARRGGKGHAGGRTKGRTERGEEGREGDRGGRERKREDGRFRRKSIARAAGNVAAVARASIVVVQDATCSLDLARGWPRYLSRAAFVVVYQGWAKRALSFARLSFALVPCLLPAARSPGTGRGEFPK